MRVLLDANIIISYLLVPPRNSPIDSTVRGAFSGTYTLLLPEPLLDEISRAVNSKPYLRGRVTTEETNAFIHLLRNFGEPLYLVTEESPLVVRDPKDNYLLAYALAGRADYLVTGDRDLLTLGSAASVIISTPGEFALLLQ